MFTAVINILHRQRKRTFNVAFLLTLTASGFAENAIPEEITIGDTADNQETSAAVDAIFKKTTDYYNGLKNFESRGTWITISKKDSSTTPTEFTYLRKFSKPDHLSIKLYNNKHEIAFIANGTTVTEANLRDKIYIQYPQPKQLSEFTEYRNNGDLKGCDIDLFEYPTIFTFGVSPNPFETYYRINSKFVYEGKEEVDGHSCHRIRVLSETSSYVVMLLIDTESGSIRKQTYFYAYDKNYDLTDDFENSSYGELYIFYNTDSDKTEISEADYKLEHNIKDFQSTETIKERSVPRKGLWNTMLINATKDIQYETSVSLTKTSGTLDFDIAHFTKLEEKPKVIQWHKNIKLITYLSKNNQLYTIHPDGKNEKLFKINFKYSFFRVYEHKDSFYVLAQEQQTNTIFVYDSKGNILWTLPLYNEDLRGAYFSMESPDPAFYLVSYAETDPITRKVSPTGKVLKSIRKGYGFFNSTKYNQQDNKFYSHGSYYDYVITPDLNQEIYDSDGDSTDISGMDLDFTTSQSSIVLGMVCGDDELHFIRYSLDKMKSKKEFNPDIDTITITNIENPADTNLQMYRRSGKQNWILSDYRKAIYVTDNESEMLYTGKLDCDTVQKVKNNDTVIQKVICADFDGNGNDEVYFLVENEMFKMNEKAAK